MSNTTAIAAALALLLAACDRPTVAPTPAPTPSPIASPQPAPSPTPTPPVEPPWQPPQGWTQMRSEEGRELAYIAREPITCQSGGDYCFEFDIMARKGCPNALYVEGQLIDPNTDVVVGMGNDLLPRLLPGQAGRVSINTQGPNGLSWVAKCY